MNDRRRPPPPPPLARLAAAAASSVAVAGCGDRSPVWSQPANIDQAFSLNGGGALVDPPADRVLGLPPAPGRSLRAEHLTVGKHILTVQPPPRGNKLLVLSAGHRAPVGDTEPDEKPSL